MGIELIAIIMPSSQTIWLPAKYNQTDVVYRYTGKCFRRLIGSLPMWCAVRIADDCWRQVWADTSVTIGMAWYGMVQRLHRPIFSSEFLPKFWVFLRISAKISAKILPQKARNHEIRDKKARECDICDKKEKKHPPAVTKCNVKIQNDPRGPKSDHKWPQMT